MRSFVRRIRRLKFIVIVTLTSCILCIFGPSVLTIFDSNEISVSNDLKEYANLPNYRYFGNKTFGRKIPITYVMRRNRLLENCASLPSEKRLYEEKLFREHLLVDSGRNLVFCGVEKVGLTFWRRFFSILIDAKKSSPYDIRAFDAYIPENVDTMDNKTEEQYNQMMGSSLTVMFSRDPYERLFSAYIDKFISPNINFWILVGTGIVRKYRDLAKFSSLRCGNDVSFAEFVKYTINLAHGLEKTDSHFITITEHCRPCHIRYDIIGKMGTFYNDTMFLIRTIGHTKMNNRLRDQFNDAHVRDQFQHSVDLLFFFKKDLVDRHKCVPSFFTAQQRMWRALQLRGLISLKASYPIKRSDSDNVSHEQLLQLLFKHLNYRASRVEKRDVMLTAYASVDMEDLHKLRDVFRSDCVLFDYDCSPVDIFNRARIRKQPKWFLGLD
ncbi:carbohydrate sulfotransferase 11-like [Ylistrum balloti]|uniref:carbohydrate sulfotransferase 11-like n=1 Tax=Ylistrum balloti TaxID=509963 RepID=UPI002905E806|nr:carbohydrate sulfotransferase 11-like [Ylistrum balloti]